MKRVSFNGDSYLQQVGGNHNVNRVFANPSENSLSGRESIGRRPSSIQSSSRHSSSPAAAKVESLG
jgi:hypothetical protein